MVQEDPKARPFAAQALAQFTSITRSCKGSSLRWRLRPLKESRWSKTLGEIKSGGKEAVFVVSTILLSPIKAIQFAMGALRRKQAVALAEN